jgi:ribosomal protein S12 methylthiotransferase
VQRSYPVPTVSDPGPQTPDPATPDAGRPRPDALVLCFVPLGCPKNLVDAERMMGQLALAGFILTEDPASADVIVVNTCDFIAAATEESREALAGAARLRREGGCRRLVVAGCMAQRRRESLLKDFPEIDAIVGVFDRDEIAAACRLTPDARRLIAVSSPHAVAPDLARFRLTPRHFAYLRISEGCDNCCAYCAIPSIRGPLRSKPLDVLLAEARELAADGAVELNLVAQDTTAYGQDGGEDRDGIVGLLRALEGVEGVRWLRLLYAHPAHLTKEMIDFLAASEKMCRYIDLPLQHASDRMLAAMGRRVTAAGVRDLVRRIRERVPDVTLRTTFIVGFPGETDADFEELLDLVRTTRFEHVGAFTYSAEAGTRAAEMPNRIPEEVKTHRFDALMSLAQRIAFEQNRARVGSELAVLVDGPSERFRRRSFARGQGDAPDIDTGVHVRGNLAPGSFVTVRITAWQDYDLLAERV